ncbi:hypothetical protein GGI12_005983 [Dipsacomyces acuminosporus]|nr:hypothetical protein GGI12_005983 [Dipsacomyces acuminosporus]
MACDVRPRLGITDKHYTGNSLVGPRMALESSELCTPTTPESLARIALRVRELVDYIDSKYVGSLLDTLESSPTFHTQSLGTCLKYSDLTITNHTRLEMYNANFGDGVQQWSSSAPWMKANIVFIQPCPPGKTGVNVFIDGSESIMKSVLNNTFWMSVAELVY